MSSLDDAISNLLGKEEKKPEIDFVCCARFSKGGSNCRICPLREEIKQKPNEDNKEYESRLSKDSLDFAKKCNCQCEINYHGQKTKIKIDL